MGIRKFVTDRAVREAKKTPDGRMEVGDFLDKYYYMEKKRNDEPTDAMIDDIQSVSKEIEQLLGHFLNDEKLSRIRYLLSLYEEVNYGEAERISPTLNYIMSKGELTEIEWFKERNDGDTYAVLKFKVDE